jgi:hypothetical protein
MAFRAWKNFHQTNQAEAVAAEAVRERDALHSRYQKEIDQLKHQSIRDLEFEREHFNISITYTRFATQIVFKNVMRCFAVTLPVYNEKTLAR